MPWSTASRRLRPPPAALLEQARKAARNQVSLDTVLRRYLAGHALLVDLVIEEANAAHSPRDALQEFLGTQAVLLDRLLAAVAEAYSDESESLRRASSDRGRRLRTVERLLAGEPLRAPGLRYELDVHTALIVSGPGRNRRCERPPWPLTAMSSSPPRTRRPSGFGLAVGAHFCPRTSWPS